MEPHEAEGVENRQRGKSVVKSPMVQMFEELTGFRAIMYSAEPCGSTQIKTKCNKLFLIRQDGPNLEVIRCYSL